MTVGNQRATVLALSRRRLITLTNIAMSVGLTGVMSLIFHRELRPDMLATGFICAVIIDYIIRRMTKRFRRRVEQLQSELEQSVTERTAQLSAAQTELHVKDRLATAGTLAAGVCHEIRSPLSVLMMGLDMLEDAQLDEDLRPMITDLVDATKRITTIVKDLSTLAQPGNEELALVELAPVVAGAARLATYKFDKNVVFEKTFTEVPPVTGNAGRLGQVVLNLLSNAARATRPGAPNRIRLGACATADAVVLSIADTGTGMSAVTQQRLFEPFFTTGADRGGTGLGLAICRSIVERMGGSISISSELGVGTTVSVTLRRALPSAAPAARGVALSP